MTSGKRSLKKKRKKRGKETKTPVVKDSPIIALSSWQKDLIFCLALALILVIIFFPFVFQDQIYPENDNIHFPVVNNLTYEYQDRTGEIAYWNPNPWGGIPNVFKIPRTVLSWDHYLTTLSEAASLPYIFFLWGSIGLFFLSRHLGFNRLVSAIAALLFVVAPYNKALIIVGHVDKIQALNHLPWVLWSLLLVLKEPKGIHTLFFALAFSLELRANHYQITFYGAFLMLFIVMAHVWPLIRKKNWSSMGRRLGLLVTGGVIAILVAAEPFIIAYKNSGQSVRSLQTIKLTDNEDSDRREGMKESFVKPWSFTADELLTLVVPRVKGGISDNVYPPAHNIGFKDGLVSSYWGHSPFNATYYYVGVISLLLICFSFFNPQQTPTFWALVVSSVLMILWSMGTRLGFFYDFCYSTIPFFKNFRTPSTSLSMLSLTIPLLSLYGLTRLGSLKPKIIGHKVWIPTGIFLTLGILLYLFAESVSFVKNGEDPSTKMIMALSGIRKEMLMTDLYIYFGILTASTIMIWLFVHEKVNFGTFTLIMMVGMLADLLFVQQRYPFETISKRVFNQTYLSPTETVRYLQADAETFRVLPFSTTNFGLPAHVQTFGSGNDLQMNVYAYELATNCLHHKLDGGIQLNWNVLNTMNIKYVVAEQEIQHPYLSLEMTDNKKGLYTHRYKFDRPRGFFVDQIEVIQNPKERLHRINSNQFDTRTTAILERNPSSSIRPASQSHTEVIRMEPNRVTYNVNATSSGLFVMSELYAPASQQIFLDGNLVSDVYKTNHAIQSIIVPEGLHTIDIRYNPKIYQLSYWLTRISLALCYILLLWLIYRHYSK